ncbi:hypothetical protein SHKM778_11710 [Streptomyces sp. KM77-8]|uniref:Uncharacterized protein n=1 Tax=Streptomyces haneummycinicus TaxID=3074435 RepID=A0AAT9HBN6_9ACTN
MERGDRHRRVGGPVGHRGRHRVDVLADQEGAGALDEEDDVDGGAVEGLVGVHGVQDGGLGGGGVAGDGGGPQDDLGAGLPGGGRDGLVVGGDDHVGDVPGGPALAHGARHQGTPPTGARFFAGTPLEPPRAGITASTRRTVGGRDMGSAP